MRRFAARPPRRPPVRPSARARCFVRSFDVPLFFLRCSSLRCSKSGILARSMQAHRQQKERERERERGTQAAYQRNFLGVIDRPLPPPSRPPVRPSARPSAFPLLSLFLLPSPDHSRRTQNTPKERTFLVVVSPGENSGGRFAEGNIWDCDTRSLYQEYLVQFV